MLSGNICFGAPSKSNHHQSLDACCRAQVQAKWHNYSMNSCPTQFILEDDQSRILQKCPIAAHANASNSPLARLCGTAKSYVLSRSLRCKAVTEPWGTVGILRSLGCKDSARPAAQLTALIQTHGASVMAPTDEDMGFSGPRESAFEDKHRYKDRFCPASPSRPLPFTLTFIPHLTSHPPPYP
jgi:hypothetical protein